MAPKVAYSTPMMHVAEIERSIRFYNLLGFETIDTDGCKPLGWARLHCEGGALMFLRAEDVIVASAQAILLYMYSSDIEGLRKHLLANGVEASEIRRPEYMPSGEMSIKDPDGFLVLVAGWGKKEQEQWEKRIAARK